MKKTLFGIAIVAAGLFGASCGNKNANNAEAAADLGGNETSSR